VVVAVISSPDNYGGRSTTQSYSNRYRSIPERIVMPLKGPVTPPQSRQTTMIAPEFVPHGATEAAG
jgi:hypothetical protein